MNQKFWHTPTQAPYMSALAFLPPTVNLQLLNGCYGLMLTFQMSNDYTDKQAILKSSLFWVASVGGLRKAVQAAEVELVESTSIISRLST